MTEQTSWSKLQTYLTCPRKYELRYVENLEKIPGAERRPMILGTAFHAGIAEFLDAEWSSEYACSGAIDRAVAAALVSLNEQTVADKTYWDYEQSAYLTDNAYYEMINDLHHLLPKLLMYHLPLIGIGTRYVVATVGNLFPAVINGHKPMIEYEIDTLSWKGYVDAVLIDMETGQQVAVDWKVRSSFPFDAMASIDGQLPFYAAVLNEMGANISQTIMWQFKNSVPKPARINKNGQPSIAAQDTTWEYWVETLPAPLQKFVKPGDTDRFGGFMREIAETLKPKLKTAQDFQHPVIAEVTDFSSAILMGSVHSTVRALQHQIQDVHDYSGLYPAILSSYGCKGCEFWKLCSAPLKYGGDAADIVEHEYQKRGDRA